MELGEKGLLDTSLHFGDPTGVSELIQDIAHRRGLGQDLAEGTKRMAARFGGTEFAPHVKGLTQEDDTLPDRILYEPTFEGQTSGHPLDQLLPAYYKKRGWDEKGVPKPKTLARLGVKV